MFFPARVCECEADCGCILVMRVLTLLYKNGFEIPLQASLDAANAEVEKWTGGFANDSLLPPGVTGIIPLN